MALCEGVALSNSGYQPCDDAWLDNLPDSFQESAIVERLTAICEYDFGDLEALEPPRGFGRD